MKKFEIHLNTIQRVKDFVNDIQRVECDVTMTNEHYKIDSKSIMGIFSLNIEQPLYIYAEVDTGENVTALEEVAKKYE